MRVRIRIAAACCAALIALPCPGKTKARDVWKSLLAGCAENDLLGSKVLYFGPSNELGAGSILRKQGKGYGLRYRASDLNIPASARVISRGRSVNCSGAATRNFSIGGGAAVEEAVLPVGGSALAQIRRGRSMTLGVKTFRWDTLVEGVFENWFRKSAPPGVQEEIYAASGRRGERLVVTRALWLSGFTAEIEFDSAAGAAARAAVPAGLIPASQLGFAARFRWSGNEKLTIESSQPFYIGGEISEFSPAGIRGEGPPDPSQFALKPVTGLEDADEVEIPGRGK